MLLINGLLAASEISFVSARRNRLRALESKGSRRARAALRLAENPTRFLSTVQVGITLVGILLGAVGEGNLAIPLANRISAVPALAPYAHAIALAIVVIVLTILSIVVGELFPKRLALAHPEAIAVVMARPMTILARVTSPLVSFLSLATDTLLRLFGIRTSYDHTVTIEEFKSLLEQGKITGLFDRIEHDIVKNALRLDERRVSGLMTPRRDIIWLDVDDSPEVMRSKIASCTHTRFPVGHGSIDNIMGVVRARDILGQVLLGQTPSLPQVVQPALFVPESMTALELLEALKKQGTHVAIAFDEYGGTQGIVTLNDILAAIVGDIPKPGEIPELEVVQRSDGSWLLGGSLPIQEFFDMFQLDRVSEDDRGDVQTLGGFVMNHLGRIPKAADYFEWANLRLEVMDMDGNRVDKVLVSTQEPAQVTDEDAGEAD